MKKLDKMRKLKNITLSTLLAASIVTPLAGCSNTESLVEKYESKITQLEDENNNLRKELDEKTDKTPESDVKEGMRYYHKYLDSRYGGVSTGWTIELTKDNKKYLVDENDHSKVFLSEYEKIGRPYKLKYYAYDNGGYDHNTTNSDGFVIDIIKDGKKYLVDANDFTQVLLTEYENIYCEDGKIVIIRENGKKELKNKEEFVPVKSLTLK